VTDLIPFLVTGIVSGSLYGLAGVGLVLTYRTSGVFNFGHGALAAGSAYLFYTLHVTHGLPWPVAAGVTLVVFGVVVGAVLERLTRSLGDVPEAVVVVATVGLLLGIQGFLWLAYGNAIRQFPQFLPQSGFEISGITVTYSIEADATVDEIKALVAQSQKRSAVYDIITNPTNVTVEVA